jgi:hypothetical protein
VFKAPYKLKDRKSLLKLLKQQDLKGLGGVLLDDVQESLPHCEKALKVGMHCDYSSNVFTFAFLDTAKSK